MYKLVFRRHIYTVKIQRTTVIYRYTVAQQLLLASSLHCAMRQMARKLNRLSAFFSYTCERERLYAAAAAAVVALSVHNFFFASPLRNDCTLVHKLIYIASIRTVMTSKITTTIKNPDKLYTKIKGDSRRNATRCGALRRNA
jgi:ABC-type uncharacterized transport system permease subunit